MVDTSGSIISHFCWYDRKLSAISEVLNKIIVVNFAEGISTDVSCYYALFVIAVIIQIQLHP